MLPIRNLGDILALARDPLRTAFIDLREPGTPRRWTYARLRDGCRSTTMLLHARGISAGQRVAILADNRAEFVIAYLAIMQAGATAVPINHRLPTEVLRLIFEDAGHPACLRRRAAARTLP